MTDWSKLKVTDLKEELKTRGIPLTGLKLKQQFIDKLAELESAETGKDVQEQGPVIPKNENDSDEPPTQPALVEEQRKDVEAEGADEVGAKSENTVPEAKDATHQETDQPEIAAATEASEKLQANADAGDEASSSATVPEPIPTPPQLSSPKATPAPSQEVTADSKATTTEEPIPQNDIEKSESANGAYQVPQPLANVLLSGTSTPTSQQITAAEILEDSRKRKRRSVTPPPSAADIAAKKAKASNGSPIVTKRDSSALEEIQQATNAAQAVRSANGLEKDESTNMIATLAETESVEAARPEESETDINTSAPPEMDVPEHYVAPARHPATSSLYMRNFKRPLQLPSLRTHISNLAQPSSTSTTGVNSDPITAFYLDAIRTHAFVSFTSIAAASRVRSAMHDNRFPDEASRVPLFVDFIPDEKVKAWIHEETDSGGGRGSSAKYEVVYHDGTAGVEAKLQIVGSGAERDHSFSARSTAQAAVPPRSNSSTGIIVPAGVHPDRVRFVPPNDSRPISSQRTATSPPSRPSDANGTGFKALDELFSFTSTKPKLYYKPAHARIAEERLDRFRDLRSGWESMGKSGDEGMKRYTFESVPDDKGREAEEWIDKGPEFGFGPRGQDRLAGRGGRGRGGGYHGRFDRDRGGGMGGGPRFNDWDRGRGDSWRGR